jgi:hypothetical protein
MTENRGPQALPIELRDAELADEQAYALPAREAMSTVGADPTGWENFAMPINEALAFNHESTDSLAFAEADQTLIMGPLDAAPDPTTTSDPTQEG